MNNEPPIPPQPPALSHEELTDEIAHRAGKITPSHVRALSGGDTIMIGLLQAQVHMLITISKQLDLLIRRQEGSEQENAK